MHRSFLTPFWYYDHKILRILSIMQGLQDLTVSLVSSDQENLQCALPKVPAVIGGGESSGTRFGDQPNSRLEYDGLPGVITDQ